MVSNYFLAASQNDYLKRDLETAHNQSVEARAIELENQRLKRLLKLTQDLTDEVTTSRIVSSSFESSRRLATLAAGRGDGVQIGYPVRAPEGLVGRIVETGQFASRVLLLTDGASNVPVQLAREDRKSTSLNYSH